MAAAFVFPGQGSQAVGMGKALAEAFAPARAVFEEVDAASAVAAEAAQGQVCQAANDNGGGQVVLSGDKAAVERAVEIAKAKGAKRAMLLNVSAPFHCALMQPAADVMADALAKVSV